MATVETAEEICIQHILQGNAIVGSAGVKTKQLVIQRADEALSTGFKSLGDLSMPGWQTVEPRECQR
jgi:hypothetical protein